MAPGRCSDRWHRLAAGWRPGAGVLSDGKSPHACMHARRAVHGEAAATGFHSCRAARCCRSRCAAGDSVREPELCAYHTLLAHAEVSRGCSTAKKTGRNAYR